MQHSRGRVQCSQEKVQCSQEKVQRKYEKVSEARSEMLRIPQNVPAQTVSWPDDPV